MTTYFTFLYFCFIYRWVPKSARLVALGEYARSTGALQVFPPVSCLSGIGAKT